MNWSRCSRAVAVAVILLVAAVAPAVAVSTEREGVPEETAVGSEVTATYTFTDLYTDFERWTLRGETDLADVTWTVRTLDQAGNRVAQHSYDGASFDESVDIESDSATVVVEVRGTVPEVDGYRYDPPERYTFARFQLRRDGGTTERIAADRVHHYTDASRSAREAIASAEAAIEAVGGHEEAERTLSNAVSAYEAGNFGNAVDLASQAEERADRARRSQNTTQLVLFGGIGVAALLLVGGGVVVYRSRRDTYDKLR